MPRSPVRCEQVRHQQCQPGPARTRQVMQHSLRHRGRTARGEPFEMAEQGRGRLPAREARRRPVLGERVDADGVAPHQSDEPDGCRQTLRVQQLAVGAHGRRRVDQQPDVHLVVGLEQLDEQYVEAGHQVIVDEAKVVAGVVLAVVGEVERGAVAGRAVLTGQMAGQRSPGCELEPLETAQQRRRQQRHYRRLPARGGRPSRRGTIADLRLAPSGTTRRVADSRSTTALPVCRSRVLPRRR